QRDTFLRLGEFGHFERPYRTIDPEFEATIVETLGELAEAGQLYKGLRSTLWCIHDETALAEAEIEYKERVAPSIYVRFSADDEQRSDILRRAGAGDGVLSPDAETPPDPGAPASRPTLSILIWTTTPWTLPANAGIALKPEAQYGIYRRGDELLLVADALAADV